jgi:hypothetical protein
MRGYDHWKTTDPTDGSLGPVCSCCKAEVDCELCLIGGKWVCADCLDAEQRSEF